MCVLEISQIGLQIQIFQISHTGATYRVQLKLIPVQVTLQIQNPRHRNIKHLHEAKSGDYGAFEMVITLLWRSWKQRVARRHQSVLRWWCCSSFPECSNDYSFRLEWNKIVWKLNFESSFNRLWKPWCVL